MRRWLGPLLGAAVMFAITSPALAGACAATATPNPAWHGAEMTVSVSGFAPGEDVYLQFPLGSYRVQAADGNGATTFTFTLGDTFPDGVSQSWNVANQDASCSTGGSHPIYENPPPTTTKAPTPSTTQVPTTTEPPTTTTTTTEPPSTTEAPTTTTMGPLTTAEAPTTTMATSTTLIAALPPENGGSNTTVTLVVGALIGGLLVSGALVVGMRIGEQRRT